MRPDMPEASCETERLEGELHQREAELARRYCMVGQQMIELAEREQREIARLLESIVDIRTRLAIRRNEISCPYCMGLNEPDSNYCKRCGKQLLQEDTP